MTKRKSKSKAKSNGKSAPLNPAALTYAKQLAKDYGPVDASCLLAKRYPDMRRRDFLAVAVAAGINKYTAATQRQRVRSGEVEVTA